MKRLILSWVGIVFLFTSSIGAQTDGSCPTIVATALAAANDYCTETGRNQVCYGNISISAVPQDGAENLMFEQAGDIANVSDILSLILSPMDEENGRWGVALMRLQANLPDTLPGQNVTFLLFGDVQLTTAVDPDSAETPFQAFYLTTGIGDSRCREAPESGLLVQTPAGAQTVRFTINEVEVEMGSTVLFQAASVEELTASTLEGTAVLTIGGKPLPVVAGTRQHLRQSSIEPFAQVRAAPPPQEEQESGDAPTGMESLFAAVGEIGQFSFVADDIEIQSRIEPYTLEQFDALPLGLLEREITITPALSGVELAAVYVWLRAWITGNTLDCSEDVPGVASWICEVWQAGQ